MICLTGNVHHHSYHDVDTWYSAFSEARLALRYSEIAARYGVKITLFITGKTCRQEPALIGVEPDAELRDRRAHILCLSFSPALDMETPRLRYHGTRLLSSPRYRQDGACDRAADGK